MSSTVEILHDAAEISRKAAEMFIALAADVHRHQRTFHVALAGGSTPKSMYGLLVSPGMRERVNWKLVAFFFGDERAVPPEHPDSNYRMAYDAMFRCLDLTAGQVHRMKGERGDLQKAATDYEDELREVFGGRMPAFDLILLGMGPDGHTASLFPGDPALKETARWVTPVFQAPKPPPQRLTLTIPVLNHAREVIFLVTGEEKGNALREVLKGDAPPMLPAAVVNAGAPRVTWLVDHPAAQKL